MATHIASVLSKETVFWRCHLLTTVAGINRKLERKTSSNFSSSGRGGPDDRVLRPQANLKARYPFALCGMLSASRAGVLQVLRVKFFPSLVVVAHASAARHCLPLARNGRHQPDIAENHVGKRVPTASILMGRCAT